MPRNRSLPPHLERRQSGYFWRRRLPCPRLPRPNWTPSKKSFLCFSLRTHVPREAKILARRLTAMSDMVFAAVAETTMTIAPHPPAHFSGPLPREPDRGHHRRRDRFLAAFDVT